MTLQLEEGKYYRDTAGRKIGPLVYTDAEGAFFVLREIGKWRKNGSLLYGNADGRRDLVAEWIDEPVIEAPEKRVSLISAAPVDKHDIKMVVVADGKLTEFVLRKHVAAAALHGLLASLMENTS